MATITVTDQGSGSEVATFSYTRESLTQHAQGIVPVQYDTGDPCVTSNGSPGATDRGLVTRQAVASVASTTSGKDGGQLSVTTTSGAIVASLTTRRYLLIVNPSDTVTVFLKLGATATANDLPLLPGASFELQVQGGAIYTGAVNGIVSSGTQNVNVVEW